MKSILLLLPCVLITWYSHAQYDDYERGGIISQTWLDKDEQTWSFEPGGKLHLRDITIDYYATMIGDSLYIQEDPELVAYYIDQEYKEKEEALFKICTLTNQQFSLYPLNASALELIEIAQRNWYAEEENERWKIYESYLKELSKAGKNAAKRKSVIDKYKSNYQLDIDTVKLLPATSFFEPVQIDSIDVSMQWTAYEKEATETTNFNYFRWVKKTSSYYFFYTFKDKKFEPAEDDPTGQTIRFVPPVIVEESEMDEEPREEYKSAQDSLAELLDLAPPGMYTGKFSKEGGFLLESALQFYGLTKAHPKETAKDNNHSVRVYHDGTYTDIYYSREGEWNRESGLITPFADAFWEWTDYIDSFDVYKGEELVLPIARF